MKHKIFLSFFLLGIILISGCFGTRYEEYTYQIYVPVYKSLDEIRNGVEIKPAQQLRDPGKIYIYGQYLLINERGEGIHIIDNSNPSSPQFISFIAIPGNYDLAVNQSILYTDSYIDLVAFDISNPATPTIVKRVESIFPNMLDPDGQFVDNEKGVVVDYIIKDTTVRYAYSNNRSPLGWDDISFNSGESGTNSVGGITGVGGSMARFTIVKNYMYSVDRSNLQTFDISIPSDPKPWAKINIGWNIETIFPYKDKLFIGSMQGMFIYDISNPLNPVYLSEFTHARNCDPVVADDKYAYITLRSGTRCGGNSNQLDIVDISNIIHPKHIKTYPMQGPAGLGIDGNILFICDGIAGLKVFDAENPEDIKLLSWESDLESYDIIPLGKIAIVICNNGLFQYDYSDPKNLKLLSVIAVDI